MSKRLFGINSCLRHRLLRLYLVSTAVQQGQIDQASHLSTPRLLAWPTSPYQRRACNQPLTWPRKSMYKPCMSETSKWPNPFLMHCLEGNNGNSLFFSKMKLGQLAAFTDNLATPINSLASIKALAFKFSVSASVLRYVLLSTYDRHLYFIMSRFY